MIKKLFEASESVSEAKNDTEALHSENRFFMLIVTFLLPFGALANFLVGLLLGGQPLYLVLENSMVLILFIFCFIVLERIIEQDYIKMMLFGMLYGLLMLFDVISFYPLIGPAVWVIAFIMGSLVMVYTRSEMLILYGTFCLLSDLYLWLYPTEYEIGSTYYLSMLITLVMMIAVMRVMFQIVRRNRKRMTVQYRIITGTKNRLFATLNSVGDGVISTDVYGRVEFLNPVAEMLTGWDIESAKGLPFDTVFRIINEYSRESLENPVQRVLHTQQAVELANHTILVSKDGTERPIEDTAAPIFQEDGTINGVVLVFRDFSEKKEKRKQIEFLSYHDQLTGIFNRRYVMQELAKFDAEEFFPLTVMYADVNGLKIINDAFGHDSGNLLLIKFADVLSETLPEEFIISRIGGDEFLVVMPHTNEESASGWMERIQKRTETEEVMNISMSVSLGAATKTEDSENLDGVLRKAENMMYSKKILMNASKRSAVVRTISHVLNVKNQREEQHSKRVSAICVQIAKAFGLNEEKINEIQIAGELHDIGKIAIDDAILNKEGKLSMLEQEQIRIHPEISYRLLNTSAEYFKIAEAIYQHHERWDGQGYPNRVAGEEIHWIARVIAVADAYDAMCSERPYRTAMSREEAAREIRENAGKQFDPEIVEVFLTKVLGYSD